MALIPLVFTLIIIGIVLYLINTLIPMPAWIKTLINALVAIFIILWILQNLGYVHSLRLR